MESVSEDGRSLVLKSLEGEVCSPNQDATEGRRHNSTAVPYLESYYPKYSRDPRFNLNEQILIEQDKPFTKNLGRTNRGCKEFVQETG
jgi:hypothetical protein